MKQFRQIIPSSIRWFSVSRIPRTLASTVLLFLAIKKINLKADKVAVAFSISEKQARLWLYFCQKFLPNNQWDFLIVDCAGDMNPENFQGAQVVRFLNFSHGFKIDFFLRRILKHKLVFIGDDDKYLISEINQCVDQFSKDEKAAVVSFCPRVYYRLRFGNEEFSAMGSYSLIIKRRIFLDNKLSFRPVNKISTRRFFYKEKPGYKRNLKFDTGDFANEQLIAMGYKIIFANENTVVGFDGLSQTRILLLFCGKEKIAAMLASADKYRSDGAGANLRRAYGIAKVDYLFSNIFHEEPELNKGFSEQELRFLVNNNKQVAQEEKLEVLSYFDHLDRVSSHLL